MHTVFYQFNQKHAALISISVAKTKAGGATTAAMRSIDTDVDYGFEYSDCFRL